MASVGRSGYNSEDLVDLTQDLLTLVKDITSTYDKEDRPERDSKKQLWLKLEAYFNGQQRIYWDAAQKDWSSIDSTTTARHYDKIENIYRAHAESIIAALSIKPPTAIFYPDDADQEEDIVTAKACIKIKDNIERNNQAQMMLIKALLVLFNQGTCCAYIYNRRSPSYGTFSTPEYSKEGKTVYNTLLNCPECGSNIDEIQFFETPEKVPDESLTCPVCGYKGTPNVEEFTEQIPEIIGSTITNKARTTIELFSPLFVWLPFYARRQEHIPYLRLRTDQHYAAIKNLYPRLKKKGFTAKVDQQDTRDRQIEVDLTTSNLCTVDCWWVRPWAYDVIDSRDEEVKKLKKKFPDGFYAVYVNDELVEIHNEDLDMHWSITANPLSTYIHGDPIGKVLAPIQDLKNEVLDLEIETFEHAIPETFARADVLDFDKYKNSRAAPGMIYPVKAPVETESIAGSFHSVKTATISEEYDVFSRRLDEKAQFVSASFPSIYGGPSTSGSKTAREYTESRGMALQRLSLPWNVIKFWWADIMSKAVPLQITAIKESGQDEKIVQKEKTGFVNTWIKQHELTGKIGTVEADTDENLPMTPGQLKDTIMQLVTIKDDFISDAITHPQNAPLLTRALGAPDFYIPGSDDRDKQMAEIGEMLSGVYIPVNVAMDNHAVEAETLRSFRAGPTGLMMMKSNPEGMELLERHYQEHMDAEKGTPKPVEEKPKEPKAELPPDNVARFPVGV